MGAVSCKLEHGALVVALEGDVDHYFTLEARESIDKEYKRRGARDIVFDFSDVGFMDSSGVGMLIGRYKQAQMRGGRVYARGMGDGVAHVFEVSGLGKIIGIR